MKQIALITALACGLAAPAALAAPYDDPFTSIIHFGDSLMDDGKFGELFPPSLGGRFTNGPTFAELLSEDFTEDGKPSFNFALGGATAEDDNENDFPPEADPFKTFSAQIGTFAATAAGFVGDNPLFNVLMGANDILQDLGESPTVGQDAANAVKAGIEAIGAINSNFRTFVVGVLGDPTLTPRFANSPFGALAQATTEAFNAQMALNIDMLETAGFEIVTFDLDAGLAPIFDDPGAFGILNTTDPCTATLLELSLPNCAIDPFTFEIDLAAVDAFLFVDDVHPNRIAHEELAQEFRSAVAGAAVPLPAGLVLALSGFGAMALARRRAA